ncbi:hypothetical protein QA612_02595 [Evansella sp. AB-P1]|uniref:hypothetical protein n=1 Tax=Evansella sp. AB-P1 TaxID=3037653 RepID=UPI00241FFCB1|nr:hypothetical protein [Evansella sp. AB-P1]MDG5786363.1 hypothetical protein [Evansella sp. AB-P1]
MRNDEFDKFLGETRKPKMDEQEKNKIRQTILHFSPDSQQEKRSIGTWKKIAVSFSSIGAVVLFATLLLFNGDSSTPPSLGNSVTPEDVSIKATLMVNDNDYMSHKDYVLEVVVHREKDGWNMIYPFIQGTKVMGYTDYEADEYFIPGSIGRKDVDVETVINALIEEEIIAETDRELDSYSDLLSFWTPEEAGEYKVRMYFEDDGFTGNDPMYVVYIHKEGFGREVRWTKVVEVESEVY